MTADTRQRAIFDESARYHRFLEYRVDGEVERGRAERAVASVLTAARDGVDRPARIVVAFGRRLWSALATDSVPTVLRDFETIRGVDGHVAPATQCDLWIWLQGDDMPADSHVSRTDVKKDGVAFKVYRRSAPYATLARHGLYFLAFARARERHQVQLERMYGVSGDGLHDRLIEFSRADTGSYLFAPGARALAEATGI